MVQALPYGEYDYVKKLDDEFATAGKNELGYFVDMDLQYTDIMKKKTRYLHLVRKLI